MKALLLVYSLLFLFVSLSHQYGTVLVDNVNSVKQDSTFIQNPQSTNAVTTGFNAATINVADPHGVAANIPTDLTIQGQTTTLTGQLGTLISGQNANIIGTNGITTDSDSLQILTTNAAVEAGFSISFDAGTTFSSLSDELNFQSLFGWSVSSALSSVTFESQIQTNLNTDALTVTGDDSLNFNSAWGGVSLAATGNAILTADTINSDSQAGTHLVAGNTLSANSANSINAFGGLAAITSFADSTISSPGSAITFEAGGRIFGSTAGNVTFNSPNGTTITTNNPGANIELISTGSSINFDSYYFNVNSYSTSLSATDSFAFEAVGLTFNVAGSLSFGDPTATQAFNFNSTVTTTFTANSTLDLSAPYTSSYQVSGAATFNAGAEFRAYTGNINYLAHNLDLSGANFGSLSRHGFSLNADEIFFYSQDFNIQARNIQINEFSDTLSSGDIGIFSLNSQLSYSNNFDFNSPSVTFTSGNTAFDGEFITLDAPSISFVSLYDTDILLNKGGGLEGNEVSFNFIDRFENDFIFLTINSEFANLNANFDVNFKSNGTISIEGQNAYFSANAISTRDQGTLNIAITNNYTLNAVSTAFEGYYIQITGQELVQAGPTVNILSPNSLFTVSSNQVDISTTSGDVDFISQGNSQFTASNLLHVASNNVNFNSYYAIYDAGAFQISAINQITGIFNGDAEFVGDSITFSGSASLGISTNGGTPNEAVDILTYNDIIKLTVGGATTFGGGLGSIHQESIGNTILNAPNNLTLDASTSSGTLNLESTTSSISITPTNNAVIQAGNNLNVQSRILSSILLQNTGGNMEIQANNIVYEFPNLLISTGDFSANFASGYFKGARNGSTISLNSGTNDLSQYNRFSATNEVVFAQDDSISWTSGSTVSGFANTINVQQSNSAWFQAGTTLGIQANTVSLSSGGGAAFNTTGNIGFLSTGSNTNILQYAANSYDSWAYGGGMIFSTAQNNINFQSNGNIRAEARTGVLINSTAVTYGNPSVGTASVNFIASELLDIYTDYGGIVFRSYSPVAGSSAGVNLVSNAGDAVFSSPYNNILATALDQLTFNSVSGLNILSYNNFATAVSDIDYNALNGNLHLQTANSTLIQAGSTPLSHAPFAITAPQGQLFLGTRNEFTFQSYGPADANGNGVSINAQAGGIRFATGIYTTFSSNAANSTFINSGLDFTLNTTKSVSVYAQSSSIAITAQTDVKFTVIGSPINFTTSIGSVGTDSFTATNGFIISDSLYSILETAQNNIVFQANTGINYLINNGRFDVSANQSTSTVTLNAGGSLNFFAQGLYDQPEDGIYFGSAYNIKLQASNLLNLNTANRVSIGAVTSPTVNINAGGSAAAAGVTITADGSFKTLTQNTYTVALTGTFNVLSQNQANVISNGPATLSSIGTSGLGQNILLRSSVGTLSTYGQTLDTESTTQFTAQTFGQGLIRATGQLSNSGLFVTAGDSIALVSTNGISATSNILQATLTNNATLTASNVGTFTTDPITGGDISFTSASTFTAVANGDNGIYFESDYNASPIEFTTYGANSALSITAGGDSNIDISAGKRVIAAGKYVSYTSTEDVQIVSNNDLPTTMGLEGAILVAATASITETSTRDVSFTGLQDVIYRTFGSQNGIGGPIVFNATDKITLQTTVNSISTFEGSDFIDISNEPGFGGKIDFVASRNLEIIGGFLNITAAGNFQTLVTNDITYTLSGTGGFTTNVGGALGIVSKGKSGSNNLGIVFEKSNNGLLSQTLISANSDSNLNVYGETGVQFKWSTDPSNFLTTTAVTNKQFNVSSAGASPTGDGILFQSNQITIDLLGLLTSNAANTYISGSQAVSISSTNTDPNGKNGLRFESLTNTLFNTNNLQMNLGGFYAVAGYVNLTAAQSLSFTSNADNSHILIDASGSVNVTGILSNSFTATGPIDFVTNGGLLVNTSTTMTFNTAADISITTLYTALNATITSYAVGSTYVTANSIQISSFSPLVESNINFLTEASRININTNGLAGYSDTISFVATSYDIDITCQNYGDFYVSPAGTGNIYVQASGGFVAYSVNNQTNDVGILVTSTSNVAFNAGHNVNLYSAGTAEFSSTGPSGYVTFSTIQSSGDDIPERLGDILLDYTNDINFSAPSILISSERSLKMLAATSILFQSYSGAATATTSLGNALFYIPTYAYSPTTCSQGQLYVSSLIQGAIGNNPQAIRLCGCATANTPHCVNLLEFTD